MKIKYTQDLIGFMRLFDNAIKVKLRDCFIDNQGKLTFVVDNEDIGKAIGKNASNIKLLESKFKKKIRMLAYHSDKKEFIKNLIYPVKSEEINEEEGIITIKPINRESRGLLIGRNA